LHSAHRRTEAVIRPIDALVRCLTGAKNCQNWWTVTDHYCPAESSRVWQSTENRFS